MSRESRDPAALSATPLKVGRTVTHTEFGEGVVVGFETGGFVRIFFRSMGERKVPRDTIRDALGWNERIAVGMRAATPDAVERLALAIEATELPLMESAATLTSAKVDLLPHQVVLVHRVSNAQPRRFLIADEVGLGKTVETALILRELASRGEMTRALMVVPAGLVENWRRELNDVFNLDFEVFGVEGDVSDRRTNAFAKHNRIIASIDTLKRPSRVKRLKEAPPWDLIVFDEAHHLSAYKAGNKAKKTENYRLAEALRDHCRDLLLLSATPHQGDHFRFWMVIRLLDPGLFADEHDMTENRHRLNGVVIRRTKADACAPDGSALFARRVVHTEQFQLDDAEKRFYSALLQYLQDGYAMAASLGGKNRALGFVMTIFQKIASSSFAAVRSTLRRRLLMLTLEEAIERDEALDVDGRERTLDEARVLIREAYDYSIDAIGRAQTEQSLADLKLQLLKRREHTAQFVESAEAMDDTESAAALADESAATMVLVALPEERRRIRDLLAQFPDQMETKSRVLLNALRQVWRQNPLEKIVVFTTYLGSVKTLRDALEATFPGKGVEVLRGGDHGAKTAARKRFERPDGPRVLLTTAAGREGINLQFARLLFNHDLPWNPMDLEQRIGRIHRYGQRHTAQVYNLVTTDTIEGQVFMLLEQKLHEIGSTLGKVDDEGQVTEDLRAQILGQLGTRLSYERLYQEALSDPSLRRTRQELEVAMTNATMAREVVFELFQDLENFKLADYQLYDDEGRGMDRLVAFVQHAAEQAGGDFASAGRDLFHLTLANRQVALFTTDRERAIQTPELNLLGLEHPAIRPLLQAMEELPPEERGLLGILDGKSTESGFLTIWHVAVHGRTGQSSQRIVNLGFTENGDRSIFLERLARDLFKVRPPAVANVPEPPDVLGLLNETASHALHRELLHAGNLTEGASYTSRLLGCVRVLSGPAQ